MEAAGDDLGLAWAWFLISWGRWVRLQALSRKDALEHAYEHANRAGARREQVDALCYMASVVAHGPTPVDEGLRELDEILRRGGGDRTVEGAVLYGAGKLAAMQGRFGEARQAASRSVTIVEELGMHAQVDMTAGELFGFIERAADDPVSAEGALRRSVEGLQRLGETGIMSTLAGDLAMALCDQGRFEEAEQYLEICRANTAADDLLSQSGWLLGRARVVASRGEMDEAIELATRGVEIVEEADTLNLRADMLVHLGGVLEQAGRGGDARDAFGRALEL
jgi:tetratricopeptide (TPR) repeat protein